MIFYITVNVTHNKINFSLKQRLVVVNNLKLFNNFAMQCMKGIFNYVW